MRNYEINIPSLNIIQMDLDRSVQFFDPEDYPVRLLVYSFSLTAQGVAFNPAEYSARSREADILPGDELHCDFSIQVFQKEC